MARELCESDSPEAAMFKKYSVALRLWARRFNTAEIAKRRAGTHRVPVDLALA